MEIRKLMIVILTFLVMSCNQKTFTLDEIKGTYYEVETKDSKWEKACSLVVTDTALTLTGCSFLKNFTGTNLRIIENRLIYHMRFTVNDTESGLSWRQGLGRQNDTTYEYDASFDIFEKNGIIHLYQSVEENENITFQKVN